MKVLVVLFAYLAVGSVLIASVRNGYSVSAISDWFGKGTLLCVIFVAVVLFVVRLLRSDFRDRLRRDFELIQQARDAWRNRNSEKGDDDDNS